MATHVYDEGESMVINFSKVDEHHVEFQMIPTRVAIARKFISSMGALVKYETYRRRQGKELSESQLHECDRLRKDIERLVGDYDAAVKEEEMWAERKRSGS